MPNGKYISRERTRQEVAFLNANEGQRHLQPDTMLNDETAVNNAIDGMRRHGPIKPR